MQYYHQSNVGSSVSLFSISIQMCFYAETVINSLLIISKQCESNGQASE